MKKILRAKKCICGWHPKVWKIRAIDIWVCGCINPNCKIEPCKGFSRNEVVKDWNSGLSMIRRKENEKEIGN